MSGLVAMLKLFGAWFVARVAEPTSKGAILFVGTAYVGIAQAFIMHAPIRFLVAGAVSTTFLGVMAFCYRETPAQIQSDISTKGPDQPAT